MSTKKKTDADAHTAWQEFDVTTVGRDVETLMLSPAPAPSVPPMRPGGDSVASRLLSQYTVYREDISRKADQLEQLHEEAERQRVEITQLANE
jgi:hypothetical protein